MKCPLGIYIHIPFCVAKCKYCDFCSFGICDIGTHKAYVRKLVFEIACKKELFSETHEADSIYIGGGTPSFIGSSLIADVLDAVYANFDVADDAEITLEVNPGSATMEKLCDYRSLGVNRLSIGVQSFNDGTLKFLGRAHTSLQAMECIERADAAGFANRSLDLMFGVPGQTFAEWEEDVSVALSTTPTHTSYYSLGIEEGTPMFAELASGEFEEMDEVEDRRMYHYVRGKLSEAGFGQYEISNSALPGFESRHNLKYWSMGEYVGLGLSAHSYVMGNRFSNTSNLTEYLSAPEPMAMVDWIHRNTLDENITEYVFLGLRRMNGINFEHFKLFFGKDFLDIYRPETEKLIERGLLEESDGNLRLTELGLDLANVVFREFV